jgi:AcrR family transcriptional regulator
MGTRADLGRVDRRRHARRLEILSAAARAFRHRGFAATGMREIAAVADLSPANLYHYFRGKQELLYFCQETSLERMRAAVRAARRGRGPAAEQLHDVIRAHVDCVLGEMEGAAAHLEVDDLPARLRRRIVAQRDLYERELRRIVAAGIACGEFVDCDATLTTRAILGALNWSVRWFRPDGERSPREVGEAFAAFLVRGLVAAPSRSNGRRRA